MKIELEDQLNILRKIPENIAISQRKIAIELGFSIGKLNYCFRELKKKGLIKFKNFKKNPKKLNYAYILTTKGVSEKTTLTINFMKKKMTEYEELKKELERKKEILIK